MFAPGPYHIADALHGYDRIILDDTGREIALVTGSPRPEGDGHPGDEDRDDTARLLVSAPVMRDLLIILEPLARIHYVGSERVNALLSYIDGRDV